MNKAYKYTLFTLFLALVFAFGSMAGMNFILEVREDQILTENGRVVVETPVRAWQKQDSSEEEDGENSAQGKNVLTMKQVEEVISSWNERTGVIAHQPAVGQISIEEAIKEGEEWLVKMGIEEKEQEEAMGISVSATLNIASEKVSMGMQAEPYYSFWIVQFSNRTMNAVLYINAVAGKVWGAEIMMYENCVDEISYEKLKCFVELTGLPLPDTNMIKNQERTQAFLQIDDSTLWAEEAVYKAQTRYDETSDKENVQINFKLNNESAGKDVP